MTSAAPILLLDVDGVIALLGPGDHEPCFEATVGEFPVIIAEATRERLAKLQSVFQVVWATSWQRTAAEQLGPLFGLPELASLNVSHDLDHPGPSYKLPAVQRFVGSRATAWVDDELGEDVIAWAESRPFPTMLVQTDPRLGVQDEHVNRLLTFAAGAVEGIR